MSSIIEHFEYKSIPSYNHFGRKNSPPPWMREQVWHNYIGNMFDDAKCVCCEITVLEKHGSWHAGHVISATKGGRISVGNLRPICATCNHSMSTENLYDYKTRVYPNTCDAEQLWINREVVRLAYVASTYGMTIRH